MMVVMPAGHTPRATGSVVGTSATAGVRQRVRQRRDALRRVALPRPEGPRQHRHRRIVDGRTADPGGRHPAPRAFRVHRRVQLGPDFGVPGTVAARARRRAGSSSAAADRHLPAPAAAPAAPPAGRAAQGPPAQTAAEWEKANAATLDDAALKKDLKLLWFATGKDDFLLTTTKATLDLLKKHGFTPVYKETAGGHTWINWRDYLVEFAPQLFQGK